MTSQKRQNAQSEPSVNCIGEGVVLLHTIGLILKGLNKEDYLNAMNIEIDQ